MPPFNIKPANTPPSTAVTWTLRLDEAREVAEILERTDNARAHEMAFDLRQGVQLAISNRGVQ